jgi:16S rRNA processing protein RimM
MRVVDDTGKTVGSVIDVEEYPANDVLIVRGETEEVMIPAVRDYVLNVDTVAKIITIRVPEILTGNS